MKKFITGNIVVFAPLLLIGDGNTPSLEGEPVNPYKSCTIQCSQNADLMSHEHKISFGFLNFGYERIQRDSVYVGTDAKFSSIYSLNRSKSDPLDYFVNGEVRLGYNFAPTKIDTIVPYAGMGFSMFSLEKRNGNLRDWNYATAGFKLSHQFGEIFEMGLNMKTYISIRQKRTAIIVKKKKAATVIATRPHDVGVVRTDFDNETPNVQLPEIEIPEFERKKISVKDTRWMMEVSLPLTWHFGSNKNWEGTLEPYYLQIPNAKRLHLIGSRISFGYRF